jgi:hypothetical protein
LYFDAHGPLLKPLPIDVPSVAISVVTLKDRTISPAASRFIESAREITKH